MTRPCLLRTIGLLSLLLGPRWEAAIGDDDLAAQLPRIAPKAPLEAAKALRIHPGFRAVQVAAEPLVADPVSACYDADGRLYVVEMRGYPFPETVPTGKVRRLEDRDGDGVFERGTDFLTGLNWPTGVLPYDGGVFVCAAPDLIYAKDADGDGLAEIHRVVFTGFGTKNVQQLFNGLCWGLDGWIHGATAGNGGEVRNPSRPEMKPVPLSGRDFRFKPDGSAFEAISGGGQFGHVFDDWGRRFVCNNRWHARQIVIASTYLGNNPDLVVSGVIADIASDGNEAAVFRISPPEPWRVVRSKQYEAKMKTDPVFARRLPNAERHPAGFFSSASGLTLYRGTAFPKEFQGNLFVCDVAGNLVHRKTLTPAGSIFRADRAEPSIQGEFLASPDLWFRPVNLLNTPSGTLLVLDMNRETIEHPLSIPDDIKNHLDLTSGKDRGRIYEVVPDGLVRKPAPRLSEADPSTLVRLLESPDAWPRETAQRLLQERRDPDSPRLLRAFLQTTASPLGRLHALWTLANLGALDPSRIRAAMNDRAAGVRENAVRLAEPFLSGSPELVAGLLERAHDPDPMVRFQTALTLGLVKQPGDKVVRALAAIAVADASDRWTRTAVLTAAGGRTVELVRALDDAPAFFANEAGRVWLEELSAVVGAGKDRSKSDALLTSYTKPETSPALARAVVMGLGRGLVRAGRPPDTLLRGENAARLGPLFENAALRVRSTGRPVAERVEAIRLLAMGPAARTLDALPDLLAAQEPPELQIEALRTLGGVGDPRVAAIVIEHWRALSPAVRREAAEVLLARPDRTALLLDAIERKLVSSGDLDPLRRKQLLEHARLDLRERAARLLAGASETDRAIVIGSYRSALELTGDRQRGQAVFRKNCATCHRAGGEGAEVGPNLATVAGKPPAELLVHVLDPNREVAPGFVNYNVATKDGRVISGLIAEETVAALTLKRAEGVVEVVPRNQVDAVTATGLSLMPEGLEKGLQPRDLADLFVFVRDLGAAVPANRTP